MENAMILEIADIRIDPSQQTEFEKRVNYALSHIFAKAQGFRGHQFRRCIETAGRYVLLLEWATLEDHTIAFRGSPQYVEWRALVGDFFVSAPHVEHFELVNASGA
jgi:heme-degrading monooxygenase HmoA